MSKNSYYYSKLAQSFIFSEEDWKEIVDPNDPNDNVYTEQFLFALQDVLLQYHKECCLTEEEKDRVFKLLNDLRFSYPYQTKSEKIILYNKVNIMINLTREITNDGVNNFCKKEYIKRYGRYLKFGFLEELSYLCFSEFFKEGIDGIKFEISQDVYPLTLLFRDLEQYSVEEMNMLLMSSCFLSTINALEIERPYLLKNPEIRNRFLYILRKNRECFVNPEFSSDEHDKDLKTRIQNELVLRRLEKYACAKK